MEPLFFTFGNGFLSPPLLSNKILPFAHWTCTEFFQVVWLAFGVQRCSWYSMQCFALTKVMRMVAAHFKVKLSGDTARTGHWSAVLIGLHTPSCLTASLSVSISRQRGRVAQQALRQIRALGTVPTVNPDSFCIKDGRQSQILFFTQQQVNAV